MDYLEIGDDASALERARGDYVRESEDAQGLSLIDLARDVSESRVELTAARERVRRDLELPLVEIARLIELAQRMGDNDSVGQHVLLELTQAAAVTSCDLVKRSMVSGMLAASARRAERYDRARLSYADALEGILIQSNAFETDDSDLTMVELATWTGWDEVKHLTQPEREIFDPAFDDPSSEWVQLIAWNSDLGGGQGLLAQTDATLRLGMRVRDWIDRCDGKPEDLMPNLILGCIEEASGDAFLAARYLVTLGDALAEADQWSPAIQALRACRSQLADRIHPIWMHASVQEARCHLMAGDPDSSRTSLEAVELPTLERLSELVITVAAELARYQMVEHELSHRAETHDLTDRCPATIRDLLRKVSAIFSPSPRGRTGYLRSLFFAMLVRDVRSAITTPA